MSSKVLTFAILSIAVIFVLGVVVLSSYDSDQVTGAAYGCQDSDNGVNGIVGNINYGVKGIVTESSGNTNPDRCEGASLVEYYCDGGIAYSETVSCPSGQSCKDGACVSSTYYCWGASANDHTVTTSTTKPYSGYSQQFWSNNLCYDSSCNGECTAKGYIFGQVSSTNSYECICGTQQPKCSDTDGGNMNYAFIKGKATDAIGDHSDYCQGSNLMEYNCINNFAVSDTVICAKGCKEGVCVKSCMDSDNGKDYSVKGDTIDQGIVYLDSCEGSKLKEFYCDTSLTAKNELVNCPSGQLCREGACIAPNCGNNIKEGTEACDDGNIVSGDGCSSICTIETCTDTDNGKNYIRKGTITGLGGTYTDACEGTQLREYYCDGANVYSEYITCLSEQKCSDGACISSVPVYYCCGGSVTNHTITADITCDGLSYFSKQSWTFGCYVPASTCNSECVYRGYGYGIVGSDSQKCTCSPVSTQVTSVAVKKASNSPINHYSNPKNTSYSMNEMLLLSLSSTKEKVELSNITLQADGTGDDLKVESIKVYSTNSSGVLTTNAELVGINNVGYSLDDGTVTVSLSNYNLSMEPSYLLLAYVVDTNISEGNTFQFTVKDVRASKDGSSVSVSGLPITSAKQTIKFGGTTVTQNDTTKYDTDQYSTDCKMSDKPDPTAWSSCVNKEKTRTNYLCNKNTGKWYSSIESQPCGTITITEEGLSGGTIIMIILITLFILSGGLFALWYFYLGPKNKFLGDLYQKWFGGSAPKDDELETYLRSKK